MTGLLTRASPQTLRLVALGAGASGNGAVLCHPDRGLPLAAHVQPHHHLRRRGAAAWRWGQAIVVMTRNIDLSVGSILGVVAYVVGDTLGSMPDLHPVLVVTLLHGAWRGAGGGERRAGGLGAGALDHRHAGDAGAVPQLPGGMVGRPHDHHRRPAAMAGRPAAGHGLFAGRAGGAGDGRAGRGGLPLAGAALAFLRPARRFYAVGSNPDAAAIAGINAARVVAWPS
jgi:rhamnose transport system permease protein